MKKFEQFNKKVFTHNIDTADFEYYKLEALYKAKPDATHKIHALYKNTKGEYGPSYAALLDKFFVNLPSHLNDTCDQIVGDDEFVEMINDGKCGIKPRKYTDNKGKERYSIEWVTIE